MDTPRTEHATTSRIPLGLVWLRRDLRLHDHAALSAALARCERVALAFVFDRDILDPLRAAVGPEDRRVEFIHIAVGDIDARLRSLGSALHVRHDRATRAVPMLAAELGAQAVYAARDYEPQTVERDRRVADALRMDGRSLVLVKDQAVFDTDEILTGQGRPYSVFTPYRKTWLARYAQQPQAPLEVELTAGRLWPVGGGERLPSLEALEFAPTDLRGLALPLGLDGGEALLEDFLRRIDRYDVDRDFPARRGPSYLSVHLRFGTVGIRTLAAQAWQRARAGSGGAETWLSELIWRDFYMQILHHHPRVATHAFKPGYDRIVWRDDPDRFAAWCAGRTGYPLVDAAMRQINATGYMHNRLRMVTASFLTKDLGIDWRLGERYFAERLNDFDLAANNGGWQWAASTGCDAQPYFRIFNPVSQSLKFDPDGSFIRRFVPELAGLESKHLHAPWLAPAAALQAAAVRLGVDYPSPIVCHDLARAETLERYGIVGKVG